MTQPTARSGTITRRTLGAAILAGIGIAGVQTWPSWAFWQGGAGLDDLAALPNADALRTLGARYIQTVRIDRAALEANLRTRLADGGFEAAVTRDRESGALVTIDGWGIPETEALASAWLASA